MSEQVPIKLELRPGGTKVHVTSSSVRGVDIYRFPWIKDSRGDLTVGEFENEFPFRPKRYFIVPAFRRGRFVESTRINNATNS